jgi:hypothetical protein
MQQENRKQCSCMPHIYTTALMSTNQSTNKDMMVSIASFLLHRSWYCSTMHASNFNMTRQDHQFDHSVLDCFDLGTTVDNDTFMTTISKSTNFTINSKQEFQAMIINFAFTQFFTLHSFIYSWAFLVCSQCSKYYLN